jgi:hypothetical protein
MAIDVDSRISKVSELGSSALYYSRIISDIWTIWLGRSWIDANGRDEAESDSLLEKRPSDSPCSSPPLLMCPFAS